MKKFTLLLLLIIYSPSTSAQIDPDKRATEITNEMSEVLSLNPEEKAKVYDI